MYEIAYVYRHLIVKQLENHEAFVPPIPGSNKFLKYRYITMILADAPRCDHRF